MQYSGSKLLQIFTSFAAIRKYLVASIEGRVQYPNYPLMSHANMLTSKVNVSAQDMATGVRIVQVESLQCPLTTQSPMQQLIF